MQKLIDVYRIHNNFITEHGSIKKTPADMCGIEVKGNDKWKTLIQNASKI